MRVFLDWETLASIAFPLKPLLAGLVERSDCGGTRGALIDYRFARKGYAVETMSAVIEYAFVELEVRDDQPGYEFLRIGRFET